MWTTLKDILGYLKPIGIHWFPFLILYGGLCLLISGVGSSYGVPYLFRDDPALGDYGLAAYRNSPAFLTQAAATFLGGILWTFARLLRQSSDSRTKLQIYVLWRAAVFGVFPLIAAAACAPATSTPTLDIGELFRMILGSLVGLALTWFFIRLSHVLASRLFGSLAANGRVIPLLVLFACVIPAVVLYHKLVPAISLVLLLLFVSAGYFTLALLPRHCRILGLGTLIALILICNQSPYKQRFPGFDRGANLYDPGKRVRLADPHKPSSVAAYVEQQEGRDEKAERFLIDPVASLNAWRQSIPQGLPKLVVVATSGGAYRASFWTAIVFDALETKSRQDGDLPGFTNNVRLVTGASGGMVGASYFVATRTKASQQLGLDFPKVYRGSNVTRLESDTLKAQQQTRLGTRFPIPRDTLSPVVQQLVQRDVLNTFLPWPHEMDRGRVLESQWITLNISFSQLREGELQGWRPSLILSPMLVETGQPLLISNLDLSSLTFGAPNKPDSESSGQREGLQEAVEFFRWFPEVHDSFRLQTAVRMNATFPYVSPAVSLPTEPPRRVVDAGYYDNYGVNLVVAYLRDRDIREWVRKHTSGVVIVQIRAFPIESLGDARDEELCPADSSKEDDGAAFNWLTSPIEGAAAARDASMVFRNDQELRAVKDLYEPGFIEIVTLESAATASVSWYLPARELECMRKELGSSHNKEQLDELRKFWDRD